MTINLDRVFSTLDDMEQIQIELEAEEHGVHIHTVMVGLIRDGLAAEGIDEDSQAGDSQWKSH